MKNRQIEVFREDTQCNSLTLVKYRNNDGKDGVLFIAWHDGTEMDYMIQTDFIELPEEFIEPFINDYSGMSAQNYIDSFEL